MISIFITHRMYGISLHYPPHTRTWKLSKIVIWNNHAVHLPVFFSISQTSLCCCLIPGVLRTSVLYILSLWLFQASGWILFLFLCLDEKQKSPLLSSNVKTTLHNDYIYLMYYVTASDFERWECVKYPWSIKHEKEREGLRTKS